MSFLTNIEAFFLGLDKDVVAALAALAESITNNGGAILINAAQAAVIAAEGAGGTGAQKLDAAKTAVIQVLTNQGIPFVESAVNGAIEAAVAQNKLNQAAANPAPVADTTVVDPAPVEVDPATPAV